MNSITWKNDHELFQIIRKDLFTSVIGDIVDKMGLLKQFLSPRIRPLDGKMFLTGRAMPVLEADCFGDSDSSSKNPLLNKPFGLMPKALDDICPGEVYICTGASPHYALIGEIMMNRLKMLGGVGAVVNGFSRDTKGIMDTGLPVFSYGPYGQDQAPRGKVIDFRVPIEIEGVRVNPGDIILGDLEGVCVIPREYEKEIIVKAYEKVTGERQVLKAIQGGMSAVEAWEKYGIM